MHCQRSQNDNPFNQARLENKCWPKTHVCLTLFYNTLIYNAKLCPHCAIINNEYLLSRLGAVHDDAYTAFQVSRDLPAIIRRCIGISPSTSTTITSPLAKSPQTGKVATLSLMTPVLPMLVSHWISFCFLWLIYNWSPILLGWFSILLSAFIKILRCNVRTFFTHELI